MSDLLNAVYYNDIKKVRELLSKGDFKCNEVSLWNSNSALHYAVYNNNPEMIRLLCSKNFSMVLHNAEDGSKTPLGLAVDKKYWSCVKAFAEYKSDSEDKAGYRDAALAAIKDKHYILAAELIQKTVPRITGDDKAGRLIENGFASKDSTLIDAILEANIDFNYAGMTYFPIQYCPVFDMIRERNDKELMGRMLKKGATPSSDFLFRHADKKDWDWVKLCLENFPATRKDEYANIFGMLLHKAVEQENVEIAGYLLEKNVNRCVKHTIPMTEPLNMESYRDSVTPVVTAAFRQQWDLVGKFTKHPVEAEDQEEYGVAMAITAFHGQFDIARQLLAAGAKPDSTFSPSKINAIYGAITHWHIEERFLRELVEKGIDLSKAAAIRKGTPCYPIDLAFSVPDRSVLKFMIDKGLEPLPGANKHIVKDARDGRWEAVNEFLTWIKNKKRSLDKILLLGELLHSAVEQNNAPQVEHLLELPVIRSTTLNDVHALEKAAERGYWKIVEVFSRYPAVVKADHSAYGYALLRAARIGRFDLALELLKQGASLSHVLQSSPNEVVIYPQGENQMQSVPEALVGYGPLHFAVLSKEPHALSLIEKLLECGADVNHASKTGFTPFKLAVMHGRPEALSLLLNADRIPEIGTEEFLCLESQVERGSCEAWECVRVLLDHDHKISGEEKYAYYRNYLSLAITQDKPLMVRLLLQYCVGENVEQPDSCHIIYAAKQERWDCFNEFMIADFMPYHAKKSDYLIAMFHAIRHQQNTIVRELLQRDINPQSTISEASLALAGFNESMVGFNAINFAVYYHNNEILAKLIEDGDLSMDNRYMDTAFRAKNIFAVEVLAAKNCAISTERLIDASKEGDWALVECYLEHTNRADIDDVIADLNVEAYKNLAINRDFLLTLHAKKYIEEASSGWVQQQQRVMREDRETMRYVQSMLMLTVVLGMTGLLDKKNCGSMLLMQLAVLWRLFSVRNPENVIVQTVDTQRNNLQNHIRQRLSFWSPEPQENNPVEETNDEEELSEGPGLLTAAEL